MKILHVVTSMDPEAGGVSQAIRTIIKGLSAKGITNEVACIDPPSSEFLKKDAFKIFAFGPGKTPWQYAPALLQWLRKNIGEYHTVIVHGLWQYPTYATFSAWKKIRPNQFFLMPHGMLDPYFQKAKGRKIKAIRNWLFWKLVEKKAVNNASGILFTCETEKILARLPFTPYKPAVEAVVSLGVETPPAFHQGMSVAFKAKLPADISNYWLYIARIHPKKGVDLLIDAYCKLQANGAAVQPLVIAGPGLDTEYGKQIQEMAGGNPQIHFTGMLSGDEKWGAFYGAEVFVLPSHQENFGIAVVEALGCGVPVLISDQVNIFREITAHHAGLVENDTAAGTLKLLSGWTNMNEEKKEEMRQQAKVCFATEFSMETASDKMIQSFHSQTSAR